MAKNDAAHQALSAQFSVHSIYRVYHAIVYGNLKEDEGFVETYLGRDPRDRKKMAVVPPGSLGCPLRLHRLARAGRFGNFTYIACQLRPAGTHQIRVHWPASATRWQGTPSTARANSIKSLNGQCLHAKELGFIHPATQQWVQFDSPLPAYFTEFLTR